MPSYLKAKIAIPQVTGNIYISAEVNQTQYEITYNLPNCSSSNTNTSIDKETAYSTTLTVDSNYIIKSVTVSMGGTDVTSTVYNASNNTISINSVTGNVVITANTFENLFTSYISNKRITSSGSVVAAGAVRIITNPISVNINTTIYIKNVKNLSEVLTKGLFNPSADLTSSEASTAGFCTLLTPSANNCSFLSGDKTTGGVCYFTITAMDSSNPDRTHVRLSFNSEDILNNNVIISFVNPD